MRNLALALALCGLATPAWALESSDAYSRTESNHTVFEHAAYEYYFNNAGSALTSGTVVIFDRTGTGVNVGISGALTTTPTSAGRNNVDVDGTDGDVTNIGTYITTTSTNDVAGVAGVVDDNSCADQTYCRVQVFGPRLARCSDSTDAVTTGNAVGTTTVAGTYGGGNGLGVALGACNAADGANDWVFIRPGGNN